MSRLTFALKVDNEVDKKGDSDNDNDYDNNPAQYHDGREFYDSVFY